MAKFWNLNANSDNQQNARLDLFGIIGADGFWEEGFDETSFKKEMESVPDDKALDIYINSDGGSVFTAIAIYNMINRHKGAVTITVAGIAASAATIITSVPNAKVIMPAGSMMMVHAPSAYAGQSNASQLRNIADTLDKVGGSIVDIYKKKIKCSDEKLAEIMSTDTYLTASEAVELGFADELDESTKIAAVCKNGKFIINGLSVPDGKLKHFTAKIADKKEDEVMENTPKAMTFEDFKAQYVDFYNQAKEEGRMEGLEEGLEAGEKAERERIKAIEEMALVGHENLVASAKFENPVSPEAFAIELIKAEKGKGQVFLTNRDVDAEDLKDVAPSTNAGNIKDEGQVSEQQKNINHLSNICKFQRG